MLAYVFWHWRRPEVAPDEYRARLARFHRELAALEPAGYRGSRVFAVAGVPGVAAPLEPLEDWYFIDDFAALGVLNEAAVSARIRTVHDDAAARAAGGTAGLYKRVSEGRDAPSFAAWFAKPEGSSYREFFAALPVGIRIWQRQMVLGPAPEFCALAGSAGALAPLATHRPVEVIIDEPR